VSGGERVAAVLHRHGVPFVFTLCGGHVAPILVAAKALGIRVVDVRDEATAVFAADAVARLTGTPGVAVVTAGPGVTNTITAVKNAQLAQSPVVLLGGAAATILKGRGALQDIDQIRLVASLVKASWAVKRVRDLAGAVEEAFRVARSGVPGPVFVECPVDLLFSEELVRSWFAARLDRPPAGLADRLERWYLARHLGRVFAAGGEEESGAPPPVAPPAPDEGSVGRAADLLAAAQRPLLVVGSQATVEAGEVDAVAAAVSALGVPVYLAGMARGLLGKDHPLQLRHRRRAALKEADLVLLAGFPCDFRLDYGASIRRRTTLVAVNRSRADLRLNRRPALGVVADPGRFLRRLAAVARPRSAEEEWLAALRRRDGEREEEIARQAAVATDFLNPLAFFRDLEAFLADDSVLVADGGDFVATASYVLSPRGPLRWLDPGVFGTLGVGAGFALGAKLCRPAAEVWLLWGDGSSGYGLAEIDTFVRHGVGVIALVGNDAGWTQIAREQVEILGDDVATVLARTDYHRVAEGFGGVGLELSDPADTRAVLERARAAAAGGKPVLVNVLLGKTDFRKGSISM
jgi:thiamine pyrophosphate-dependent acetolactate synthase large subunit-like protein